MSQRRGTIPLWDSHKKMPTIDVVDIVVRSTSKPMFIVKEDDGLYCEKVHRYYSKEQMDFQIGRKINNAESSRIVTWGKYEFTRYACVSGWVTVYDIESYEYFHSDNRKYVKKEQEPQDSSTVVNNILVNVVDVSKNVAIEK